MPALAAIKLLTEFLIFKFFELSSYAELRVFRLVLDYLYFSGDFFESFYFEKTSVAF